VKPDALSTMNSKISRQLSWTLSISQKQSITSHFNTSDFHNTEEFLLPDAAIQTIAHTIAKFW